MDLDTEETQATTSGASVTNGPITLFCLVRGDSLENAFPVNTDKGATIGAFKDAIKEKNQNDFANIDADKLVLWRVNIPDDEEETIEQLRNNERTIEDLGGEKLKRMTKQVGEMFGIPSSGSIHVIIARPPQSSRSISVYEYGLTISTPTSAIAHNIKTLTHFKSFGADLSFLDSLSHAEKRNIIEVFKNTQPPNPEWTKEIEQVQPWLQNVYEKLAAVLDLAVNRDTRRGGQRDEIYADHYLTRRDWSHLCDANASPIDYTKCWAFESKSTWQGTQLNEALVQCYRYSARFFQNIENRTLKFIAIMSDARNYRLYYAYWSHGDMKIGQTNDYNWSQGTIQIIGQVFKTFKSNFALRAGASPGVFGNIGPNSKIDNFITSDSVMEQATRPSDFNMNQGVRNRALYNVILQWAKKLSTNGLPIVTTTIGDIEARRLLGAGSDTVIFEGRTTSNVPVVIKYCLRDTPLEREAETLKILNEVMDIPKLLYENFSGMIPYIITSMMGQKVYKVNARVACDIIIDILGVLKNLHGHNYIHNDIHPSNVVNVDGKYRLIDFGRAVPRSDKRETIPDDWPKGHIVFASHNWDRYPGAGDDLEALCYTVAFMHNQDKEYWRIAVQDPFKALHEREKKLFYLFDSLPQAFKDFYDWVYDLDINVIPDYEYWQTLFMHVADDLVSLPQKRPFSTPPASPERESSQL